jgi:hypothetical protein
MTNSFQYRLACIALEIVGSRGFVLVVGMPSSFTAWAHAHQKTLTCSALGEEAQPRRLRMSSQVMNGMGCRWWSYGTHQI